MVILVILGSQRGVLGSRMGHLELKTGHLGVSGGSKMALRGVYGQKWSFRGQIVILIRIVKTVK